MPLIVPNFGSDFTHNCVPIEKCADVSAFFLLALSDNGTLL